MNALAIATATALENDDLAPQRLMDLALDYLKYLALDFQFPHFGKYTFSEIVNLNYEGDIMAGFVDFLYPLIFRRIQRGPTFNAALIWISKEKGIRLTLEEQSLLLFAIKQIVMTNTYEDLIQLLGLDPIELK